MLKHAVVAEAESEGYSTLVAGLALKKMTNRLNARKEREEILELQRQGRLTADEVRRLFAVIA